MDLLDVIDELTRPTVQHIAQRTDRGDWIRTHRVEFPPLLERMHEAVWPTGANVGGSKTTPDTRSQADNDALDKYSHMCVAIGSWCRMIGVKPTRDPVKDLRAWYAATLKLNDFVGSQAERFYLRETRRWKNIIEEHLDPPERFEATVPCPVCEATGWGNQFTGGSSWPIEVRYRKTDEGRMADETATCRACRTSWVGHESILELGDEAIERGRS